MDNINRKPPPYTEQPPAGVHQQFSYLPPPYQPTAPLYHPSVPNYGTNATSTIVTVVPSEVVVIGGCPACRIGRLEDDYTCLGICCAIFFFPLGILCCLLLKSKRCSNCGACFD
ncbi:brain protein I3 [Agrilus planipennis]|uniref:Membrane protein BRI3 n=1 Tax=Agrilus planipennis TaxID=224129 RepID=A0A1W4X244_AGRPL|nr:brain protein I3 [Agrilus planipennis]